MNDLSPLEETTLQGVLVRMKSAFQEFWQCVPPPRLVKVGEGVTPKFENRGIQEAIVLKAGRIQSLVRASLLLISDGFVQELGILQRAVQETADDILFLSLGIQYGKCNLHREFLTAFWKEPNTESGQLQQHVHEVPRRKITAYFVKTTNDGNRYVQSEVIANFRSIHSRDSGHVHGSSANIMELYYPGSDSRRARFHVDGMAGTFRAQECRNDSWNYIYRAVQSYIQVAHALELNQCAENLAIMSGAMVESGFVTLMEPPKSKGK